MANLSDNYTQLLRNENKIELLEPFKGAKVHHNMKCMICNHIWNATPLSKRQTLKKYNVGGCPNCNNIKRTEKYDICRVNNLSELLQRGIVILTPNYDGRHHITNEHTYEKIQVQNINCGHIFFCSPANLITRNVDCSVCGPQKRAEPLTAWSKENSRKWKETATEWELYKSEVSSLTEQVYNEHKKLINPKKFKRGKAGIEGAYHLDHKVPKRFCFDNNIPAHICADKTNLQMIGWRENVGSRDHLKGSIPPLFFNFISKDNKLDHYINIFKSILPNIKPFFCIGDSVATAFDEQSNRALLIIPQDKAYANFKTASITMKSFIEAKVNYTILFEDELSNVDLLSKKLQHYTHQNQTSRIHARQCVIKPCTKSEKRKILDENHIQGNDNAELFYGAFFNEKIVAVMTFSKPRVALGNKNKDKESYEQIWELSRFATDINYRIPGIASKLLKHFQNNHEWKEIYSFADRRWSVGNMYEQIGFTLTSINPPSYFYVVNGVRKHRWNYRKDILKHTLKDYDPSLTEYHNMERNGFWRVWDCGTLKYTLINTKNDQHIHESILQGIS